MSAKQRLFTNMPACTPQLSGFAPWRWTRFCSGCEVADISGSSIFVNWFLLAIVEEKDHSLLQFTNISVNTLIKWLHCLLHYSKYRDCFIRVIDCSIRIFWSKFYCISAAWIHLTGSGNLWNSLDHGAALERAVFQTSYVLYQDPVLFINGYQTVQAWLSSLFPCLPLPML